ncbi:MAG: FHIPEP family type III secretion protein [Deltaproteobacteria bacterium]|nr:FHIPEP family type III secretion protein [Deltaproteobacteria bacterium]
MKGRLFEFGLAAAVIAVVVMMIVPLTPWLLDLLISVNIAISVLVLCLALFVRQPLAFNAFPTLLLVATLYRLALNVSSTRLILLKANAGQIIGGFGGFVVGGDILVGAVIFGILAMVLFLVITKGAERVAEVAARFTLDALPGMQLAIDSELRTSAISSIEARRSRRKLDDQSRYYGALDGAMKFVRGDAIASLVIVGVNIAGGLAVGMLRHDMSIGAALDTYGRLTIGDGLVTMIPALLVSTAAGLLVTRVGQGSAEGRLGQQLGRQLVTEPRALAAASSMLLVLAVIPGLPAWPFILLGGILGVLAATQFRSERARAVTRDETDDADFEDVVIEASAIVELGGSLFDDLFLKVRERGGWRAVGRSIAAPLRESLGLPMGAVPIVEGPPDIDGREARIKIRSMVAARMSIPADSVLCLSSEDRLREIGVKISYNARPGQRWISSEDASLARAAEIEVFDDLSGIIWVVESLVRSRAGQLVGVDETQRLVDRIARTRPTLVRETVPKTIELPALAELLAGLVGEGISLDHLAEVLEAISRLGAGAEPEELLQEVRLRLAPVITAQVLEGENNLLALTLDIDVESVLLDALTATSRGYRLALAADVTGEIIAACREAAKDVRHPVLLVRSQLRRSLAELLRVELPGLTVLAHGEIEPHVTIELVGKVEV